MIRITNEELEKSWQNYSSCANTWRSLLKLGSTILLLINCVFKTALQALGMESGAIPDANIKASSKKTGYDAWKGRLNGQSCWMPANDKNTLSENCSLLGTDNVREQISERIFAPNGGYCLFTTMLFSSLNQLFRP